MTWTRLQKSWKENSLDFKYMFLNKKKHIKITTFIYSGTLNEIFHKDPQLKVQIHLKGWIMQV